MDRRIEARDRARLWLQHSTFDSQHAQHGTRSSAMEPSPLTQVSRPDVFQPKIIQLYETLFKVSCRLLPAIRTPNCRLSTRLTPLPAGRG